MPRKKKFFSVIYFLVSVIKLRGQVWGGPSGGIPLNKGSNAANKPPDTRPVKSCNGQAEGGRREAGVLLPGPSA